MHKQRRYRKKYRNKYLIADWTNNCIFLYNPKWVGALQVPAEKKSKIIDGGTTQGGDLGYKGARGRSLFRPTDIEIGPDGALYIAGWGSVYGTEYVPNKKLPMSFLKNKLILVSFKFNMAEGLVFENKVSLQIYYFSRNE